MREWSICAVLTGLLGCGASAEPGATTRTTVEEARVVELQGHRGARGLHPENTVEGFAEALAIGVHTLELDLGVTSDGVVVVHHDERLNPDTTRGPDGSWLTAPTPAIHEQTFEELAEYDVGRLRPASGYSARFSDQVGRDGVRIPRLEEVIEMAERVSGGTIRYNAETKLSPDAPDDAAPPEAFAEAVVSVIRRAGVADRTVVQSFDWRTLRHIQRIAPEMTLACLTYEQGSHDTVARGRPGPSPWTAGLDVDDHGGSVPRLVQAAGCPIWSPSFEDVDGRQLGEARSLGLRTVVWTVNEPEDIEAAIAAGVDGIISDYPDRVRAALARHGHPLPPAF